MNKYKRRTVSGFLPMIAIAFIFAAISCTKQFEEDLLKDDQGQMSADEATQTRTEISIMDFGAVADGKKDNYLAFVAAAAYASAHENTTINFPAGKFYIAKYRTKKNDKITHIFWKNCKGLKIIGAPGTIVSVNGKFFRPLDYTTSATGAKKSYTSGLSPFWFFHCTDLEIRNIEITGNVQNTTRDPGIDDDNPSVTESENNLLRFTKCDNVVVDQMYVHHAESDGIMISGDRINGKWINSTNFKVTNVRSYNNGRQGMSIGGLSRSNFKSCEFNYNGFTDGKYGRNDPSGGVDIEPGEFHNNSRIKFEDCAFENNFGGHFLCTAPNTTNNITLLNCSILTGIETPKLAGITVLAKNVIIDGCIIKLGTRSLKITNPKKTGSTVKIINCEIEGSDNCITSNSLDLTDNIFISNNQFSYTKDVLTKNFLALQTKNLQFLNNKVFIPASAIRSRPRGTHVLVENAIISKGNLFYTEEPAVKPRVSYIGTTLVADL
ncbi:MAG: glycosyl hydrolase family 28-related protein [Ferruginibacter sp.]